MQKKQFFSELESIFSLPEGTLSAETELDSISAWDSLAMLSVLAILKPQNPSVKIVDIDDADTVGDLAALLDK